MWKSAYVGVYQFSNWKMQGETLKIDTVIFLVEKCLYVHENNFQSCSPRIREKFFPQSSVATCASFSY